MIIWRNGFSFCVGFCSLVHPKGSRILQRPKTDNVSLGVDAIVIFYSLALSLLVLFFKWAEGYLYEILYYRLNRDKVRISKFDFAKKQRQDRLKKLRQEARERLDQFHHHN